MSCLPETTVYINKSKGTCRKMLHFITILFLPLKSMDLINYVKKHVQLSFLDLYDMHPMG